MYRIVIDKRVQAQLDALPADALNAYLELRSTLESVPHNGRPLNPAKPDGVHPLYPPGCPRHTQHR